MLFPSDDEITRQCNLHATAQCITVHRRNHRFVNVAAQQVAYAGLAGLRHPFQFTGGHGLEVGACRKALSPAPVITAVHSSGAAEKRVSASLRPAPASMLMAFMACGRSIAILATRPGTSNRTAGSIMRESAAPAQAHAWPVSGVACPASCLPGQQSPCPDWPRIDRPLSATRPALPQTARRPH